ncbi:hypothetical protein XBO1_1310004 [Xenorhabdus bovienii str. oregonense]|uniref:Uncharacterized protein n=1 Tax=Xenorhabdus bovienii str. oregonense TaxID=1398202 RepID=A0A077P0X7_XENBV|nr:hypothetical protein XBO1_1310004 [Xenorhabdus bovienii str. oregonense]
MTTRKIDEKTIYELTKVMFENLKEVQQIHSAAKYITPEKTQP